MKPYPVSMLLFFLLALNPFAKLRAQQNGVLGYWKEPGGSVIHVEPCGKDVCAILVALSTAAPTRVDTHNPDANLRARLLCGLRIGEGFQLKGSTRADAGTLYDPKSGKTYRGLMESRGDDLNLRGYIGLPMLGRTERWSRTAPVAACTN